VLIQWDGSHQPAVWCVPAPEIEPRRARLELARRYLHIFGPATAASFAQWAGISFAAAKVTFETLARELIPTRTPVGETWILAADESASRSGRSEVPAPARLLPSGDAYFLLWGADREILVPHPKQRAEFWTTRVWPGALLVNGEIAGVWRRSAGHVSVQVWRRLSPAEWEAVASEAAALPLPGLKGPITISRID